MGIFSRKEHITDPQIAIHLDEASTNNSFHPGSSVFGTISLRIPIPRQLVSVQVQLFGRTTTHSVRKVRHHSATADNTRTIYIKFHDEAQLINTGQQISGPASLGPEFQVDSQFSLTFPTQTDASVGSIPYKRDTARTGAYAIERHALPPSFSHSNRVPGSVCPSFKTLNINRSYVLKFTLEAEICGKVFEDKFENQVGIL